jgi:hypothetical protein
MTDSKKVNIRNEPSLTAVWSWIGGWKNAGECEEQMEKKMGWCIMLCSCTIGIECDDTYTCVYKGKNHKGNMIV